MTPLGKQFFCCLYNSAKNRYSRKVRNIGTHNLQKYRQTVNLSKILLLPYCKSAELLFKHGKIVYNNC